MMILVHMQCSLNKARLHHSSQRRRSWMSLQDNLTVLDKQPTQHLHTTQVKMEDASKTAQNSEIRVSRFVDTNSTTQMAKNHGQTWRTQ